MWSSRYYRSLNNKLIVPLLIIIINDKWKSLNFLLRTTFLLLILLSRWTIIDDLILVDKAENIWSLNNELIILLFYFMSMFLRINLLLLLSTIFQDRGFYLRGRILIILLWPLMTYIRSLLARGLNEIFIIQDQIFVTQIELIRLF